MNPLATGLNRQPADALVVFGATGDLAHKQIFPALYAMCRHGALQVPVIGVANDSDVETYCALRLHIDSWRWGGVPWYLRSGKCLPTTACEVLVRLKPPPQNLFGDSAARDEANYVRFHLSPHATIALAARVKRAGKEFVGEQRELSLLEEEAGEQSPYERLLTDAMAGNSALFAREDAIEAAWAVVDPVLIEHPPVIVYAPGTWGPPEADQFIAADGLWRNPEPA